MTGHVALRATVFVVGALVFAYGVRADSPMVRWIAIALLGVAFLLRFVDPARRR